jgi:nanoRNase/pAp phosphatase (c-di-AMP/oligoRNAs hydrolase)
MKITHDSQTALKAIQDAQRLGLLVSADAGVDAGAALMALFHLFAAAGKKVVPIIPGRIPDGVRGLPSSIEIKADFGPKNLVVTLDTNRTPIEKVSYKAEDQKFRLTIHPRERNFEIENIYYAYEGLNFDLLVTLGVPHLADLGELYTKNRRDFSQTTIINLDVSRGNENYGQINIVDSSRSSVCELIFHQLLAWKLVPSPEVARCLLTGLSTQRSPTEHLIRPVEIPAELTKVNL